MPTTVQPERLTFALGAVAGAIATLGALKLIAVRKNEEPNRNVHGEQQRKRLPSYIILVRHGESEGNANASFYRMKPDNQGLFSTIRFIQIVCRGSSGATLTYYHPTMHPELSETHRTWNATG